MPDELDLMQLASAGQKLATLDGTDYLACHIVLAWPSEGVPALFCAYSDWAHTPIARLAAKEEEIAELATILDKWASEATAQTQRAEAAERRTKELEQRLVTLERHLALPTDPIVCPDCGKDGWKNAQALQMHQQRAHQGMQASKPRAQSLDDQGWRCAAKGCSGAHARSVLEPDFCTYHAKPAHQNGVEVETIA